MNFRFYRLIFCQCAAALANAALRFALSLHLLRVTGSAALYGSITALAMLPMLAGAFGGGFLADRFCKHRLLAALDGITAALIAVSAFSLRFKVAIAAASVYTGYKYTLHKGALLCLRKPGKNAMNGWTC